MHATTARLCAALVCLAAATPSQTSRHLLLRCGTFDPVRATPSIPDGLRGDGKTRLWVVQLAGAPTDGDRDGLRAAGGRICSYLPHDAYVVRMATAASHAVRARPGVRYVGAYHPGYRLEPALVDAWVRREQTPGGRQRYNVVVTDRHRDKAALIAGLRALGGVIEHEQPGSILVEVSLTLDQLGRAARLDQVLWVDRAGKPELDMINARSQGGGRHVEQAAGYAGQGIRGHIYEGLEATHADFDTPPVAVQSCDTADRHGHCTAGIIAGNGSSDPMARGMAPATRMFFTNYSCVTPGVSRWQVVQELVDQHEVMFTSASWGGTRTTAYTSESADADDIVFSHDIAWTQSQSNAGTQASRPQAWGKNIFSIGGVTHFDNAEASDDSWAGGSSSASTGPAADGRHKPDLCAYYDNIHTSDLTGSAGYAEGSSYLRFNGTSGATPIVAGHNAIAIEMFTDGVFGNAPRVPGGTRFENRPHFTTLKALQIANATQYPFDASSTDNRREHQGWGFPSLRTMWEDRDLHVIVDETDVLRQGEGTRWSIDVPVGRAALKVAMTFADPAGNPAASLARVNDLTLRVTAPTGETYWGNAGLDSGNFSTPGGGADIVDTVENVFVANPTAGTWQVDVIASLVAQDAHVETESVDADYALVVNGGRLVGQQPLVLGAAATFGDGCAGSAMGPGPGCITMNETGTRLAAFTSVVGFGIEITPRVPIVVTGFELLTTSQVPAVTIETALYADSLGQPGAELARGTMDIGNPEQWYATTFQTPATLAPGAPVYLGFEAPSSTIGMSIMQQGTDVDYFVDSSRFGWSGPFQAAWAFRVHCSSGPTVPTLGVAAAAPRLGGSVDLSLAGALPHAAAALTIAASRTAWTGGPLPLALAPLGAPGCSLLTSTEVLVSGTTDANGGLAVPLIVPVDPTLLGSTTFHQFWVLDLAANQLGVVTSNAASLTFGH